jgi:hypothetical protein
MSAVRECREHDGSGDAHAWAARIRAAMGWAGCGDVAHRIDTPFRRTQKWPPVDECKLQAEARSQVAEAQAAGQ